MSTIGQRVTPNDIATMRHRSKPERLPSDTMDAMAEGLGWAVHRGTDDRGYALSEYRRGPWSLQVGWTDRGGHGVRASLMNHSTREHLRPDRAKWVDPATNEMSPFLRSQDIFRWVGHRLYDEALR